MMSSDETRPGTVWVLAESFSDHIAKVTFELLGDAKKLAASTKAAAEVVLLCDPKHSGRFLEELRPYEPARVRLLEHEALGHYNTSAYLQSLRELLLEDQPFLFLIPATVNGRDLAPRLAARAGLGYFPHCLTIKPAGPDSPKERRGVPSDLCPALR